jgi:hypothetical protein
MPDIRLTLSEELLTKVDEARGDVARVRWIRRLIESQFEVVVYADLELLERQVERAVRAKPAKKTAKTPAATVDRDECRHWNKHPEQRNGQRVWICNDCGKEF